MASRVAAVSARLRAWWGWGQKLAASVPPCLATEGRFCRPHSPTQAPSNTLGVSPGSLAFSPCPAAAWMKERTSPGTVHYCGEPGLPGRGRGRGRAGGLAAPEAGGPPFIASPAGCPASTSEDSWTDSEVDSSCSGQPIHLWQFLKELLLKPHSYGRFIRWLNKEKGEPRGTGLRGLAGTCWPPTRCQAPGGWGQAEGSGHPLHTVPGPHSGV